MPSLIARPLGILAAAILAITIVLLAGTFLPTLFGYETLLVTSGSMGTTMRIGSAAITRPVDARAVTVGDVISFRHVGRKETITHRVVAVDRQGAEVVFTTKGDANPTPDPEPVVVRGNIHRVVTVVPIAGWVVRYARSPAGALLLFLVPIVGLTQERLSRGRQGRRRRRPLSEEAGWSATTFAFVRVTPGAIRSEPGG